MGTIGDDAQLNIGSFFSPFCESIAGVALTVYGRSGTLQNHVTGNLHSNNTQSIDRNCPTVLTVSQAQVGLQTSNLLAS